MNKINCLKNKKNKKGFTLIELIVVMAVIGILVLLAAPKFLGYTKDANVTAMQADAKILSNAALMYNINNERFPVGWTDAGSPGNLKYDNGEENAPMDNTTLNPKLSTYLVANGFVLANDKISKLQGSDLTSYIKNTKNPITDYVIVTNGILAGDVFSVAGVADKAGILQFGVSKQ